jgi:nitrite reductase/ring-hydroxylating ferredoxin subunit
MVESLVRLCRTTDVDVNSVKAIEVRDAILAVYNIGGTFYVTDDTCTHGAASLAEGYLDGDVIECCLHSGAFHVPTGKPVALPCAIPLRTYKVVVRDEDILVDLDAPAEAAG